MRRMWCFGLLLAAGGCSQGEPVAQKPPPRTESTDPALKPVLPSVLITEPDKTFSTLEEGIAYWEQQLIEDNQRQREKKTKEEIQKRFDRLPANEKANIERIRAWLPNKRITEMGNVDEDIPTLATNADQFEPALAIKRMLEYADESGAQRLLKNLGVTNPKAMVRFRLAFGQITPDQQTLVWGVTQRVKEKGFKNLSHTDEMLLQKQALFPTIFQ
jgi:hypothetical protein